MCFETCINRISFTGGDIAKLSCKNLVIETLKQILFINKIMHTTQWIKGILIKYISLLVIFTLFTAVFAPVKTIDVVYNRDLKVLAKRNIHVKMPTMCRVQFNRRGWNLVSVQNVSIGNVLKRRQKTGKRKHRGWVGCTEVFNSNTVEIFKTCWSFG